jgi:hypothetical protein
MLANMPKAKAAAAALIHAGRRMAPSCSSLKDTIRISKLGTDDDETQTQACR